MKMNWKRKILLLMLVGFLSGFVLSLPQAFAREQVYDGDSYQQVLRMMGTPQNHIKSGREQLLFYGSSVIELMDGKVVRIDGRPASRPGTAVNQAAGEGAHPVVPPEAATAQRIIDIRQQGRAMDIRPLLVSGGYTVVAFYADW